MAWSYDLLDDAEKALLDRCSVFAGGFDLQSACAVAGFRDLDDFAILDLLDALVRKSLLVADRSAGRTRFSMLETIRQFAEEQLVARGEASEIRAAHSRYFAGREADIMALWDSPRQREAYDWFTSSWPICAPRFGGPPTTAIWMSPPPSPPMRGCSALWSKPYEPIAWAEELIEPARAVDHPRLAFLYVIASLCCTTGRIEAAVRYSDAGQIVLGRGREALPYGIEAVLGAVYLAIGQPERLAECVPRPARTPPRHPRPHPGMSGYRPFSGRFRWGGDGLPRMASSRLRRQQATRACSRGRSGPTVSLSVTRIPSGRLTPWAGVW